MASRRLGPVLATLTLALGTSENAAFNAELHNGSSSGPLVMNAGQGAQFATTMHCGGPFGPDSTFCDTVLKPTP